MFGSAILDTAIGLIFAFFIVSNACSSIYSFISNRLNQRGELLNEGLQALLGKSLYTKVTEHELYKNIDVRSKITNPNSSETTPKPAYIDPKLFSRILLDIIRDERIKPSDPVIKSFLDQIKEHSEFIKLLDVFDADSVPAVEQLNLKIDNIRGDIETWYNNGMDALTDIYRARSVQFIGLIAIFVTVIFNINTITIAETLWKDPSIREATVAAATAQVQEEIDATDPTTSAEEQENSTAIIQEEFESLSLPVGWNGDTLDNLSATKVLKIILGWIMTIGAAMFGGPFWFDLLQRLTSFRESSSAS